MKNKTNTPPKTTKERQAKRLALLNKIARKAGWETWSKYETAVINQVVDIAGKGQANDNK